MRQSPFSPKSMLKSIKCSFSTLIGGERGEQALNKLCLNIYVHDCSFRSPGQCIVLRNCLFVRKCIDKSLCDNFNEYFQLLSHSRNTRGNNSSLKLPSVKLEFERKGFIFSVQKYTKNSR